MLHGLELSKRLPPALGSSASAIWTGFRMRFKGGYAHGSVGPVSPLDVPLPGCPWEPCVRTGTCAYGGGATAAQRRHLRRGEAVREETEVPVGVSRDVDGVRAGADGERAALLQRPAPADPAPGTLRRRDRGQRRVPEGASLDGVVRAVQ
eukprot:gene3217-biopygen9708